MNIEWYLISIAFLLVSMGTFLSPLLAICLSPAAAPGKHSEEDEFSLDVLLPAHNEPLSLPATITSLRKIREIAAANSVTNLRRMQIIVGLSHWSGAEALEAAKEADIVLEISQPGKWKAIEALVKASTAEWVALVDAGVIWEDNSLEVLKPYFLQEDIIGINPRFQALKGGFLQKSIWFLESCLKLLENRSGGPISLHGATVFYRRKHLENALQRLKGTDWLNDDVVVPLTLRTLYPKQRIVYTLKTSVTDFFPSWDQPELQRRKRLLLGNLQWVQGFYFELARLRPVVAILATRRVARMVWAWWIVFLATGFLFLAHSVAGFATFAGFAVSAALLPMVAMKTSAGRRLFEAFWVSFAFPFYYFSFRSSGTLPRWK